MFAKKKLGWVTGFHLYINLCLHLDMQSAGLKSFQIKLFSTLCEIKKVNPFCKVTYKIVLQWDSLKRLKIRIFKT